MVGIGLLLLFWLLGVVADYAVGQIPFEYEQSLAATLVPAVEPATGNDAQLVEYLQQLTDRLAAQMDLAAEMQPRIHYADVDDVNAYATLGGQMVMLRGLLEELPHENALAMVLAHEIAHLKLRHPLRSFGRGVVLALAISALSGASGNTLGATLIGETGLLSALEFSREQESAADREALAAVVAVYGHSAGSGDLFAVLADQEQAALLPMAQWDFLRSHPTSAGRSAELAAQAREHGWPSSGDLTPLPAFVPRPQ